MHHETFIRNALLGAAGLVVLSVSAHAAGSTAVTDTPVLKSNTAQQLAQRPYDPSAGSVGFKKKSTTQQTGPASLRPQRGQRRLQEVEEEEGEEVRLIRSVNAPPPAGRTPGIAGLPSSFRVV